MLWIACCLALMGSALAGCGVPSIKPVISGYNRILNGHNAVSGSWPWQVSLQDSTGFHFCSGSLINEYWVMTSALCGVTPGQHRAILGEYDRSSNTEPIQNKSIARVITNPQHNSNTFDSDIALVKLSSPALLTDRVQPVCLATSTTNFAAGTQCVTTGWGHTGIVASPPRLQQVSMPLMSQAICQLYWGTQITNNMMCAGAAGASTCLGDSGGPLVCESGGVWQQVGIVSWGFYNCYVYFPGVFTRISALRSWIDVTVATN
ncbi:chymotrypsin-like protease CTRL-1 [Amia ocellicauda]|uniref:chymotrypsin-like protease CTRL-1 n=1 Tax=Amia ocellicauda TaxID=2972642 RepID=UPI00346386DB